MKSSFKMRKSSSVQYLPSTEVIIHRNDFLMHINKNSFRSQSIDCALERKHSSDRAATLPRRSSSAVGQKKSELSSVKGRRHGQDYTQTMHHSLERKRASGLSGMKARMLYSGSHSTSCLPRNDQIRKNRHKEKDEKNANNEENSKNGKSANDEKNGKVEKNQETTVTSFLSFLEQPPSEMMRKHLNLGTSHEKMQTKSIDTLTLLSSENDKYIENLKTDVDEKKVKIKVAGKVKKVLQGSLTAPVTKSRIPTPSIPSYNSLPRKVKFAGSLSAPISGIKKTGPSSSVFSSDVNIRVKQTHAQMEGNNVKNVKKVYPKKVSSEYASKVGLKVVDGLCLSDYNNLDTKSDQNSNNRGYNTTWRQRLLGSSTPSQAGPTPNSVRDKVAGKADLVAKWLKLKTDIENAMARKPEKAGVYKDLREMFNSPKFIQV